MSRENLTSIVVETKIYFKSKYYSLIPQPKS